MSEGRAPSADPPAHATDGSHAEWGAVTWLTGSAAALVAVGIFLSLLMGSLDQFVVLNALPKIVVDLGDKNAISYIVSAYLITSTVAVPIFGRLSDMLSRRNVFLVGMSIFIAGSILAGLSQNLGELIAFRAVQGFGSGCFFPVGISIIAVAFDPAQRARLTGLFSGVFGIATVAGPFLGDWIVTNTTWRWVFYINIPIGVLGMAVLASGLGPLRPRHREAFDAVGSGLLCGWVGSLMFALFQVSNSGWAWVDPRVLALLAVTFVLLPVFVLYELRIAKPIVPLRLLRDRVVASSAAVAALSRGAVFSLLTVITVYVAVVVYQGSGGGEDAIRNMLYFMVIPMVFAALLGGQLLTRTTYRVMVASGLAVTFVGMVFLLFVKSTTPLWSFTAGFLPTGGLILPLMPIGFGLGLTFGPTTIAVQFRVPPQDVGQATGIIQFLGTLAAALGLSLFTTFQANRFAALSPTPPYACYSGTPPPNCPQLIAAYQSALLNAATTSYVDVFAIMVVLSALALVASLFLTGRMPKGQGPGGGAARLEKAEEMAAEVDPVSPGL